MSRIQPGDCRIVVSQFRGFGRVRRADQPFLSTRYRALHIPRALLLQLFLILEPW